MSENCTSGSVIPLVSGRYALTSVGTSGNIEVTEDTAFLTFFKEGKEGKEKGGGKGRWRNRVRGVAPGEGADCRHNLNKGAVCHSTGCLATYRKIS